MRDIIIVFLLALILTAKTNCQDIPSGHTVHYGIRMWSENDNPSADSLNENWIDIDKALYNLIVMVDSHQMTIRNDTLIFSDLMSGQDKFTGATTVDTVIITAVDSNDVFLAMPRGTPTSNDVLGVKLETGRAIIQRQSNGTADLRYNWIWIRKYQ